MSSRNNYHRLLYFILTELITFKCLWMLTPSLVPRPYPVFKCCTLNNGQARYAKHITWLRWTKGNASNYRFTSFLSIFSPFLPSPTKDFRKATKWRQVSLRMEIAPTLNYVNSRSVPGETSLTWAHVPGPPVFQCATLKKLGRAWGLS